MRKHGRALGRRYGHAGRRVEKLTADGRIKREKDRLYFFDKSGRPASVERRNA